MRAAVQLQLIDGMMHCISMEAANCLSRLAEHFDLLWATGWQGRANQHLAPFLALPDLPHVDFGDAARFGSADWKLRPLELHAADRPLAWVDDNFESRCIVWAAERAAPTKLISVEPNRGLERPTRSCSSIGLAARLFRPRARSAQRRGPASQVCDLPQPAPPSQ